MTLPKSAALFAATALWVASTALAQSPPSETEAGASYLVLPMVPAKSKAPLLVFSPAFQPGGDIPFENTQYRGNVFPGLTWSAGPAGTRSYVVIMQDTDGVRNDDAILHWTAYNIPAETMSLAKGMTALPAGASYGPNIRGAAQAYMGPRTPAGPKHRYHFQVFALDTMLMPDPAMSWNQLKAALNGHVLASGELIGLGQVDPNAPPPAAGTPTTPPTAAAPPATDAPIPGVLPAGERLLRDNCNRCHKASIVESRHLSRQGWQGVIKLMRDYGLSERRMSPGQAEVLIDYLAATQPPL